MMTFKEFLLEGNKMKLPDVKVRKKPSGYGLLGTRYEKKPKYGKSERKTGKKEAREQE